MTGLFAAAAIVLILFVVFLLTAALTANQRRRKRIRRFGEDYKKKKYLTSYYLPYTFSCDNAGNERRIICLDQFLKLYPANFLGRECEFPALRLS